MCLYAVVRAVAARCAHGTDSSLGGACQVGRLSSWLEVLVLQSCTTHLTHVQSRDCQSARSRPPPDPSRPWRLHLPAAPHPTANTPRARVAGGEAGAGGLPARLPAPARGNVLARRQPRRGRRDAVGGRGGRRGAGGRGHRRGGGGGRAQPAGPPRGPGWLRRGRPAGRRRVAWRAGRGALAAAQACGERALRSGKACKGGAFNARRDAVVRYASRRSQMRARQKCFPRRCRQPGSLEALCRAAAARVWWA